jgi:hypothetical protein
MSNTRETSHNPNFISNHAIPLFNRNDDWWFIFNFQLF